MYFTPHKERLVGYCRAPHLFVLSIHKRRMRDPQHKTEILEFVTMLAKSMGGFSSDVGVHRISATVSRSHNRPIAYSIMKFHIPHISTKVNATPLSFGGVVNAIPKRRL